MPADPTAAPPTGTQPQPGQPAATPVPGITDGAPATPILPGSVSLQFRLTNGESMRANFDGGALLSEVRSWLDVHRTDGGAPYLLVVPYPLRVLGPQDLDSSLVHLGVAPRSTLVLEPGAGAHAHRPGAAPLSNSMGPMAAASSGESMWGAAPGSWLGYMASALSSVLGPVASWLQPATDTALQGATSSPAGTGAASAGRAPDTDAAAVAQPREAVGGAGQGAEARNSGRAVGAPAAAHGSVRRRGGGKVYSLADVRGSGHEDGGEPGSDPRNMFWNGNSTQFGGGPDDKRPD